MCPSGRRGIPTICAASPNAPPTFFHFAQYVSRVKPVRAAPAGENSSCFFVRLDRTNSRLGESNGYALLGLLRRKAGSCRSWATRSLALVSKPSPFQRILTPPSVRGVNISSAIWPLMACFLLAAGALYAIIPRPAISMPGSACAVLRMPIETGFVEPDSYSSDARGSNIVCTYGHARCAKTKSPPGGPTRSGRRIPTISGSNLPPGKDSGDRS